MEGCRRFQTHNTDGKTSKGEAAALTVARRQSSIFGRHCLLLAAAAQPLANASAAAACCTNVQKMTKLKSSKSYIRHTPTRMKPNCGIYGKSLS
jgi:hypothetical protein